MRQWLYNEDGGKLFNNDAEIETAIKNGYVDTPTKVGQVKEAVIKKPSRRTIRKQSEEV